MDHAFGVKYHAMEQRHAWFWARRDMIDRIVRSLEIPPSSTILEVGCSGGPLIQALQSRGYANVVGIDIAEDAVRFCREKGLDNVLVMDGTSLAFPDHSFDVVISSDVLEHIAPDHTAISQWNRVLKPGGSLIIFVPAFGFLWSDHDDLNHHVRRYSRRALRELLESHGFETGRASYWNMILFLPVALVRLGRRAAPSSWRTTKRDQLYGLKPPVNAVVKLLLRIENALIARGIDLPLGVSVFAVAKKRECSARI